MFLCPGKNHRNNSEGKLKMGEVWRSLYNEAISLKWQLFRFHLTANHHHHHITPPRPTPPPPPPRPSPYHTTISWNFKFFPVHLWISPLFWSINNLKLSRSLQVRNSFMYSTFKKHHSKYTFPFFILTFLLKFQL